MNPVFDPAKVVSVKVKPLPVIMLLDVSGTMAERNKIQNLNDAVKDMLESFRDTENGEIEIHVSAITFGNEVRVHQVLASSSDIKWVDLPASGGTPLGTAIKMAKAMIADKTIVPSRAYSPVVVLISDGCPTDEWEQPLADFIGEGRSSKCDRMALAIGPDADKAVLEKFIEGTQYNLFYAENAKHLRDFFKFVTMSVTTRTESQDPNVVTPTDNIDVKPTTIDARKDRPMDAGQQGPSNAQEEEQPDDEGYW